MAKFFREKDPTFRDYLIQVALKELGYYKGELDNWAGPLTEDAYEKFHKEKLEELGKAEPLKSGESGTSTETGVDIPPQAIEIIKEFESCLEPSGENHEGEKLYRSYADPGYGWKVPTIGWGTVAYENGEKVKKGDIITQSRADELLLWEVKEKAEGVNKLVTVPLTANQFSALISFAYNAGLGALGKSTLLKKLNAGDPSGAADELLRWDKSNGVKLRGLTRRREAERKLFLT